MLVDNTDASFDDIAQNRLPEHFGVLQERMANPFPMTRIAEHGVGVKTALGEIVAEYGLNREYVDSDFNGAYVYLEGGFPIYVGISQKVVTRLNQHVKGKTHYDASLAYRMAKRELFGTDEVNGSNNQRQQNMDDKTFQAAFEEAKCRIAGFAVAVVDIENPIERYLFEVYAAMEMGTGEYNSFETH